jgi:hypothetical protein
MQKRFAAMAAVLGMAGVLQALAQDDAAPESLAQIKPGETGRLERDSVRDFGPLRRFDVAIVWSGDAPRPPDHAARSVRYVADCKARTLAVAAVGVFDSSGRAVKNMVVPPGATEANAPAAGSPEARWLEEVCRF